MEIKSNQINSANAEIKATILTDEVNAQAEKDAKQLAKTANVQGFRKGKVPVSIIKKQYGDKLVQEAESEVIRDVLNKGLDELNIDAGSLIGEPNVSQFDKSDDKIDVTIKVAIKPEIELGDYTSMVEDFEKPVVSDEEVDDRIKELAESQAPMIDVEEDRELISGDTAVIDFEGSVDGKVFDGGTAKDFALLLGSGQFIPGFEDQVIGMKNGEEKVVKVTFPENYGGKELAGKDAEFKVKVNKIQTKGNIEINDELAQQMLQGQENVTVDTLKNEVKTQIENEKLSKLYNDELKPALLGRFVENLTFDLPNFVVEQEIDMAVNNKAREMSEDEIKELRENEDKLNELRESFREDASQSVRATFIIDSLAKELDVKVAENEIMQTIYFEAMQTGRDPQKAYEEYKNAGYLPAIQMSMVEDKVLSSLLNSKIQEA